MYNVCQAIYLMLYMECSVLFITVPVSPSLVLNAKKMAVYSANGNPRSIINHVTFPGRACHRDFGLGDFGPGGPKSSYGSHGDSGPPDQII